MAALGKYFRKVNWLFWILVIVSVGLHLALFLQFRQVSSSSPQRVIEVTVDSPAEPEGRRPPEPPARPPVPEAPDAPRLSEIAPADVQDTEPEAMPEDVVKWQGFETFEPTDPQPEPGPEPENRSSARAEADALDAYFALIRSAIERNKQYPAAARRRRLEGRVTVSFVVDSSGGVSDPEVVDSSGFSSLDRAALRAVRAAGPFEAPPEELRDFPMRLEIPIVFQLRP